MAATRQKTRKQTAQARALVRRRKQQRQRMLLLGGVGLVAVAVVAALALARGGPPALPLSSADKTLGEAGAPVVVLEYADFQCPYCRDFQKGPEQQLKQEYIATGKVRFIFRNMAFIGDESIWAAQAAECANEQGHFWDYHDKLFAEQRQENSGTFSYDNLKKFAADLGLDTAAFNKCVDSNKYRARIQQELAEGQQLGVTSTPSLFVDGKLIAGGANYPALKAAIDAALASKPAPSSVPATPGTP